MFFRPGNNSGITFIETLIAVLLLTLMVGSVLAVFVLGSVSVNNSKHRAAARNILRAQMETVKNTPYADIASSGPAGVTIDASDNLTGERAIAVADHNGYKEISITLSWTEVGLGGRTVNEVLVTYMTRWSL